MKASLLAILFSLSLSQLVLAQSQQQQIGDIDKTKQEIKNNLENLQKVETYKDSNGYSYAYSDKKDLKLEALYVKDQNIEKHVEWYFLNGDMIFASQLWINTVNKKTIVNEKFYLSGNHLIQWTENDTLTIDTTSEKFKRADTLLVAYGKGLAYDFANKLKPAINKW